MNNPTLLGLAAGLVLATNGSAADSNVPERPADQGEPGVTAIQASALESEIEDSAYFIEIPLVGVFNKWARDEPRILPAAVERALSYAARHKIKHIVFSIDSPGGRVDAAREIVASMQKYDDQLVYHAHVKRAISAAIWPVRVSHDPHERRCCCRRRCSVHQR